MTPHAEPIPLGTAKIACGSYKSLGLLHLCRDLRILLRQCKDAHSKELTRRRIERSGAPRIRRSRTTARTRRKENVTCKTAADRKSGQRSIASHRCW